MAETPETCPKCGALFKGYSHDDTVAWYNCDAREVLRDGEWVYEPSWDCLLKQVATLEAEVAKNNEALDRLQEYGLCTKDYGDGDASALWDRIDEFRQDPEASLANEDVRDLAEWWAELHSSLFRLDEGKCNADAERDRLRGIVDPLEELRANEGASVLVICDNPSFGGPGCAIEVTDQWTQCSDQRITGDNLADCLAKAVQMKRAAEAAAEGDC